MKLSLTAAALIAATMSFQGCGGGDETVTTVATIPPPLATQNDETATSENSSSSFFEGLGIDSSVTDIGSSIYNWFTSDDTEEEEAKSDLTSTLSDLALSNTLEVFVKNGLDVSVTYVITNYTPTFSQSWLLDNDWGDNDDQYLYESLYDSSSTLVGYFTGFYNDTVGSSSSSAPARATEIEEKQNDWIDKIIDEIYNIIQELIASYFSSTPEIIEVPVDDNSPKIDPNQTFAFEASDIEGEVYYVASQQYMSVTFKPDGLSGYGDIGYGVGASFTSYVSGGELFIDMSGVYEVALRYKDPGYCLVTEMTDTSDGSKYPAYWFSDKAVYDKADSVSTAESLCYIHSTEYAPKVIAKDGKLELILEERAGHSPVTGTTIAKVSALVDGVDNTATVKDSKYFARKMRHGVFTIYTTNEQTHTLQATETEKINRELLPLVAASALGMQELMGGAYDASIAFQEEVNRDLDAPVTEVNERLDALITATSQAMDRTTSENNYHGISNTTSYGDIVDFTATNIQSACGMAFFLCNKATADVKMTITNPADNGRVADVVFTTEIETSIVGDSAVDFSQVDVGQAVNYISGTDYNLNISDFTYERSNGLMSIKGDGFLGNASKLSFDSYDILATFTEEPALELIKFSATIDGSVTTTAGRVFNGQLVFDGENTNNSKMDGILIGINDEPKIVGVIKTSLSSEEITEWVATHESVSTADAGDLDNIGDQSYSMNVEIAQNDKNVTADMLVKRDDSLQTWTYMMQNLSVSDANGAMTTESIYLIQNGENTIVESLEKIALNGLSADSGMTGMIDFGWDVASDFDKIGVEGLNIVMKTDPNDTAKNATIAATVHVFNSGATMSADMVSSYDYGLTHVTSKGNFQTTVDATSGTNAYTNTFTTTGSIISDGTFDYLYEDSYTDAAQYILFTSKDSVYQMGFILKGAEIQGGDSYGVVAEFIMSESYDTLEVMKLRNRDENPLGIYNRLEDALKIKFADGVEEYMYLY